ncbi:MAG: hypothetical protein LBJ63_11080 [Prevotellaceae bacterium]|jgi:hypothetical protein|nr:hypothetical protein [Prevotellaceae bacterium]
MKKILLILSMLIIICNNAAKAQYEKGIMISTGYKHLSTVNLPKSYDAFTVDLTLHNYYYGVDFNSSFNYGKNYISYEPCSLIGLLYCRFVTGLGEDPDRNLVDLTFMVMAASTMSFNIPIGDEDRFIIRPYWSLMRISRVLDAPTEKINPVFGLKDDANEYQLNAAAGVYFSINWDLFMISPFCEYGFGYKKVSPFTGFNFGLSVGIKLYE